MGLEMDLMTGGKGVFAMASRFQRGTTLLALYGREDGDSKHLADVALDFQAPQIILVVGRRRR